MSDEIFKSILLLIGSLGGSFLLYLGVRAQTKKPAPAPKTTTGEVFNGSLVEGQAYLMREVLRLSQEQKKFGEWRADFTGALRRYLVKLGHWAIAHDDVLPHPDESDLPLLAEIFHDTDNPWREQKEG